MNSKIKQNQKKMLILKTIVMIICFFLLIIGSAFYIYVVAMEKNNYFLEHFTKGLLITGVGSIAILLSLITSMGLAGKTQKSEKVMLGVGLFLVITGIIILVISA